MTLSSYSQRKSEVYLQCADIIRQIKEISAKKIPEIAVDLAVRYETVSRASRGKTGSPQLLAGLKMLLELETIKRQPKAKTVEEELAELKRQIQELRTGKYPEHRPANFAVNEDKPKKETQVSKTSSKEGLIEEGMKLLQAGHQHKTGASADDTTHPK